MTDCSKPPDNLKLMMVHMFSLVMDRIKHRASFESSKNVTDRRSQRSASDRPTEVEQAYFSMENKKV